MDYVWTTFLTMEPPIMARVATDLRLQDRGARARREVRSNPYWRMICEGQHLGYYKGARGSTWIVRYRPVGG